MQMNRRNAIILARSTALLLFLTCRNSSTQYIFLSIVCIVTIWELFHIESFLPTTGSDSEEKCVPRIRGMGSAVPTVDGCPGFKIPTRWICKFLREECGIHNPATKKGLADDWAERYLKIKSVAFGTITGARQLFANSKKLKECEIPRQMDEIDELGLTFRAFDEALQNAQVGVEDVDVLVYASCTSNGTYFFDGLRAWYKRYPSLSRYLIPVQMPVGCPVIVQALKLGKNLLQSKDVQNVAIVCSNCVSQHFQSKNLEAFTRENEMERWLNALVFGDASFSCILSTSTENLPRRTYRLIDAEICCDPELVIANRHTESKTNHEEPADFFTLNPDGTKEIPGSMRGWMGWLYQQYGLSIDSFQHVVFHQANPKVINLVSRKLGCEHKTAMVGEEYGNQGGCSVGVSLHWRMTKSQKPPSHGDKVLGYALGALMGNSHGVFLLECEVRDSCDA